MAAKTFNKERKARNEYLFVPGLGKSGAKLLVLFSSFSHVQFDVPEFVPRILNHICAQSLAVGSSSLSSCRSGWL